MKQMHSNHAGRKTHRLGESVIPQSILTGYQVIMPMAQMNSVFRPFRLVPVLLLQVEFMPVLEDTPTGGPLPKNHQQQHGQEEWLIFTGSCGALTSISPPDITYWRSSKNDNLWQGVNGINNPCPAGFRLPTAAEWDEELQSWSSDNAAGAFASPLKLPMAGDRGSSDGLPFLAGTAGYYWSATTGYGSLISNWLILSRPVTRLEKPMNEKP